MSQAAEEITQLKGEIATARAGFEKKIKDLEAALSTSTKENAQLKKALEDQENSWKTRLTSSEQKLGESQESLQNITNKIGEMVKAIWGTFTRNLLHIPIFLHNNHGMLIITVFFFTQDEGIKSWWRM